MMAFFYMMFLFFAWIYCYVIVGIRESALLLKGNRVDPDRLTSAKCLSWCTLQLLHYTSQRPCAANSASTFGIASRIIDRNVAPLAPVPD